MNRELASGLEELSRLILALNTEMEQAEMFVSRINDLLNTLAVVSECEPTMLLGDIIYDTQNSLLASLRDQALVLQAALSIGQGGIGVIVWPRNRYARFLREGRSRCELDLNFTPFGECPGEVRKLLYPYLTPLIDRFRYLAQR